MSENTVITAAKRLAQWYDSAEHDPSNLEVKKAYGAFIDETLQQYDAIVKHLKLFAFYPGEKGYANSEDMRRDIHEEGRLGIFMTVLDQIPADHPLAALSGRYLVNVQLTVSDCFRAVHDYYGHGKGAGFGFFGELTAYNLHSIMYSAEANKALFTETRLQNAWVNYGKFGEQNRRHPEQTIYAPQKAVINKAYFKL